MKTTVFGPTNLGRDGLMGGAGLLGLSKMLETSRYTISNGIVGSAPRRCRSDNSGSRRTHHATLTGTVRLVVRLESYGTCKARDQIGARAKLFFAREVLTCGGVVLIHHPPPRTRQKVWHLHA